MLFQEYIFRLLAPYNCLKCGSEGSLLCDWCIPDAALPLPSRCYRCQAKTSDFAVCSKCRKNSPLKHVWVASEYEGLVKELVKKMKFERAKDAARPISSLIIGVLPYIQPNTVITHVPTATNRRRQRGYDQAELIAKELALALGCRYVSLLSRHGQTRQVGAKRKERLSQLKGSFWPLCQDIIKGANILLIDDVVTTGATLEEAARTLRQSGARQVNAAVLAQRQ